MSASRCIKIEQTFQRTLWWPIFASEVRDDFSAQGLEWLASCLDEDVCVSRLLDCGKRDKYYFGSRNL